ncbi:hypothetical protein ACFL59_02145 [Planctomycetota bacterium]
MIPRLSTVVLVSVLLVGVSALLPSREAALADGDLEDAQARIAELEAQVASLEQQLAERHGQPPAAPPGKTTGDKAPAKTSDLLRHVDSTINATVVAAERFRAGGLGRDVLCEFVVEVTPPEKLLLLLTKILDGYPDQLSVADLAVTKKERPPGSGLSLWRATVKIGVTREARKPQ